MSGIENNINNINPSDSIADKKLSAADALLVMDSRCEKSIENKEEYFKYTEFCENIFNISEQNKDNKDYVTKINNNNKDCINIFDQCLINT